jgi:glycosyltransferase involved in cell wall biosynthesis
MKILVATGIFPPQIGGPATYSKLLYDELSKRGIDVEIATFGDFIDKPKLVRHFLYFLEVLEKAKHVDLVYAQDPVSVGLPALFASQIAGKRLVLKIVGDYAWEQGTQRFGVKDSLDDFARRYKRYSWQVKLLKKIQTYVAEGAAKIITPSKYLKSIIVDWGIDPRKISVVYNGFHLEVPKTLKASLRKKHGLAGSIIITVGRLVPWKGIRELIETMPRVISKVPTANLVVVGEGPLEKELRARSKELGLEDRIRFTGKLGQKELFEYIKAADAFALNTSYEGFSHQILETMAIGTPVITTNVGGNPEAITNGKTGILLSPNDKEGFAQALTEILSERAIAYVMTQNAKKAVAKFTDEEMLENVVRELKKK